MLVIRVSLFAGTDSRLTSIASLACLTVLTQKDLVHYGYTKSQNVNAALRPILRHLLTDLDNMFHGCSVLSEFQQRGFT